MFNSYIKTKQIMFLYKNHNYIRLTKTRLFFFKFLYLKSSNIANSYLYNTSSVYSRTNFFFIFKKWKLLKKKYKKYNTFKFNINKFFKKINNSFFFKINFFLLSHLNRYNLKNILIFKQINLNNVLLFSFKKKILFKQKLNYCNLYNSFLSFKKILKLRKKRVWRFKHRFKLIRLGLVITNDLKKIFKKAFLKRRWRKAKKKKSKSQKIRKVGGQLRFIFFLKRHKKSIPKILRRRATFFFKIKKRKIFFKKTKIKQNLTIFFLKKPKPSFFFKKNLFILKFLLNSYNYKTVLWRIIN